MGLEVGPDLSLNALGVGLEPADKEAEIRCRERGAGIAEVGGGREEVPDVNLVEQDFHPRGRMLTGAVFPRGRSGGFWIP